MEQEILEKKGLLEEERRLKEHERREEERKRKEVLLALQVLPCLAPGRLLRMFCMLSAIE